MEVPWMHTHGEDAESLERFRREKCLEHERTVPI
jgi:hypothetical protein